MQNLNLYQIEKQQRSGPQKIHMLALLGVLLVLCAMHAVWQGWQLRQGAARLAQAETAAQQQENLLAAARASFVEPQLDSRLPLELAAREAENQHLQRLIGYLQVLASQRHGGFVGPLQALAEQHPQSGLWLTAIVLTGGGRDMRLQGHSQDQELLPQYLQRLGQNPLFQGREFARFDVQRGDDQLLRFDLSSRSDDKEAGDE